MKREMKKEMKRVIDNTKQNLHFRMKFFVFVALFAVSGFIKL